ncbi:uncharacterized protein A4U43_C06F7060 [Asparagus officinalis]|uniref:Drought induced 19 protein type zinc-binding domain-containing protein n=1 Tax=Asparagus officinalis TaxID=4686 RepID=A0A5P1EQS1_ASPOF|nr:protein DEHYDRATION-INDUCED 19-like [Asparagus officinalis]ONK66370.1 uncharacterized protein A4U43_C06F7060 [Asparagus officinalis]
MDSDLWIARLAAAKRHFSLHQHQNSQLDRLGMDDFEVEEEIRPDFACPYCYEDQDLASICNHLEEEHRLESKVAVCPICAVKVARDMLSHITMQHGHLCKRRRKLRRVAIPNSQALSLLGRDLREAHMQLLSGIGGYQSNNTAGSTAVTDSLLSSFVLNFPTSEVEDPSKSTIFSAEQFISSRTTPLPTWKSNLNLSLSREERERKQKQVMFTQDLLLSTLFGD